MSQEPDADKSFNFYTIASLVMDLGADVLRNLLLKEVPPNIMSRELQKILNSQFLIKLLTKDQIKLLQEPIPDPSKFDVSLLTILMKNICPNIKQPTKGWGAPPDPMDKSIGADIKRLLDIRNNKLLLHAPSTLMPKCKFVLLWQDSTNVILRLAAFVSQKFFDEAQAKIRELQHKQIDMSTTNKLRLTTLLEDCIVTSLQHSEEQREDIACSLKELNSKVDKLIDDKLIDEDQYDSLYDYIFLQRDFPYDPAGHQIQLSCSEDYHSLVSCATLVKMYPWLKDQVEKSVAVKIARGVLSRDQTQSVRFCKHRRMAVDKLLKYVLKIKSNSVIKCEELLRSEMKNNMDSELDWTVPKQDYIEDYKRINEPCHETDSDPEGIRDITNRCNINEQDREPLTFYIKDIEIIDSLNNCFLSQLYFSIVTHDKICDFLHKEQFSEGALCLLDTMANFPDTIMQDFCNTLERHGLQWIIGEYDLRNTRKTQPTAKQDRNEKHMEEEQMLKSVTENWRDYLIEKLERLDVSFLGVESGSIVFFLAPKSTKAWEQIKEKCVTGNLKDLLDFILSAPKVLKSFATGGYKLLMSIYAKEKHTQKSDAEPIAVLEFDVISGDKSHLLAGGAGRNSIDKHMNLLCEELELDSNLIKRLIAEGLVQQSITEELKQTKTRAGRIKYLLGQMSSPEKGFRVIKEHVYLRNTFLHDELEKRDIGKLLFTCEAQMDIESSDVDKSFPSPWTKYTWKVSNAICLFDAEEEFQGTKSTDCDN